MNSKAFKLAGYSKDHIKEALIIINKQIRDLQQTKKYLKNELKNENRN